MSVKSISACIWLGLEKYVHTCYVSVSINMHELEVYEVLGK